VRTAAVANVVVCLASGTSVRSVPRGGVPAEIAHEEDVARGPHDGQDEAGEEEP
jgi:hypothetical protein